MNSLKLRILLSVLALQSGVAGAHPLIYQVTTVADGALGNWSFTRAIVTVTIHTDSRSVTVQQVNGATVYENRAGSAVVTIREAGQRPVTVGIASGQLFARYDVTNGIASIGSLAVNSFYPFVIGCPDYPTCASHQAVTNALNNGYTDDIPTALAAIAANHAWSINVSSATAALPATLSMPTFLNGFVSSCAQYGPGGIQCLPPTTSILTDQGQPFYVLDRFFGQATAEFLILGDEED